MIVLVVNSFLSAFLLFQVQPIIGKILLPHFGGGASIWSATMLAFQLLLLAGYTYAYLLTSQISVRWQANIHSGVLLCAVLILAALGIFESSPIAPPLAMVNSLQSVPVIAIVALICLSVGLPYFVLASNSTLMQCWLVKTEGVNPYWIYSFSNAGSALALLSYPFLIEPFLGVKGQGWIWGVLYVCFALLSYVIVRRALQAEGIEPLRPNGILFRTPVSIKLLWLACSFVPSMFLLAVTAYGSQEIAPVPFLWIIPLFLYLLTFILTFSSERAYNRSAGKNFLLFACALFVLPTLGVAQPIAVEVMSLFFLFFIVAWFCHGELYRLRPPSDELQLFYVFVAVGGAAGGLFVSVLAPLIFDRYLEVYIGIMLAWVLYGILSYCSAPSTGEFIKRLLLNRSSLLFCCIAGLLIYGFDLNIFDTKGYHERNFYGSIRVSERSLRGGGQVMELFHGITMHGSQLTAPELRRTPISYYSPSSGIARALSVLKKRNSEIHVGVIGLGVGTLAAFGEQGDTFTFYEIDPAVSAIAQGEHGFFSYLKDSPATIDVVMGDGRRSIEKSERVPKFDLIALDAFNSDSIPVHLLTLEAMKEYTARLKKPYGILAINISNKHLNVLPVCKSLAKALGLSLLSIWDETSTEITAESHWVLLAYDADVLTAIVKEDEDLQVFLPEQLTLHPSFLWTDNFTNLYKVLR